MSLGIIQAGMGTLKWVALAVHLHLNPENTDRVGGLMALNKTLCSVAPLRGDTLSYTYDDWNVNFISIRDAFAEADKLKPNMEIMDIAWNDAMSHPELFRNSIKMSQEFNGLSPNVLTPLIFHTLSQVDAVQKAGSLTWTIPVKEMKRPEATGILSLTKGERGVPNWVSDDSLKSFTYYLSDEDVSNRTKYVEIINSGKYSIHDVQFAGDHGNHSIVIKYRNKEIKDVAVT